GRPHAGLCPAPLEHDGQGRCVYHLAVRPCADGHFRGSHDCPCRRDNIPPDLLHGDIPEQCEEGARVFYYREPRADRGLCRCGNLQPHVGGDPPDDLPCGREVAPVPLRRHSGKPDRQSGYRGYGRTHRAHAEACRYDVHRHGRHVPCTVWYDHLQMGSDRGFYDCPLRTRLYCHPCIRWLGKPLFLVQVDGKDPLGDAAPGERGDRDPAGEMGGSLYTHRACCHRCSDLPADLVDTYRAVCDAGLRGDDPARAGQHHDHAPDARPPDHHAVFHAVLPQGAADSATVHGWDVHGRRHEVYRFNGDLPRPCALELLSEKLLR